MVYDCELGFYFSEHSSQISTSGSTYSLDICLDKSCSSYFLRMPKPTDPTYSFNGIPLIEKNALHQGEVVVHLTPGTISLKSLKYVEKSWRR